MISEQRINFKNTILNIKYRQWVVSQLRICRPRLLRSGHLDIKDAQCVETKDALKKSYHITT